jgi:hypothetical protein
MIKSNYYPFFELDTKAILNAGQSKEMAIEIAHEYLLHNGSSTTPICRRNF